jgi:putative nucleotidyltransferase with HDIG domain
MMSAAEARVLAQRYLDPVLPRRWRHVQGAGARGEEVAGRLGLPDELLASAAWLHDIGYAPDLAETGFHPLDGARFLRRIGADDRLARLVAHHSCAVYEARVRGLERELTGEFEAEQSVTADALVFCDLTTAPDGRLVAFEDRMDEIEQRYGPDHDVTRALRLARPDLTSCCQRTLARLADQSVSPM